MPLRSPRMKRNTKNVARISRLISAMRLLKVKRGIRGSPPPPSRLSWFSLTLSVPSRPPRSAPGGTLLRAPARDSASP